MSARVCTSCGESRQLCDFPTPDAKRIYRQCKLCRRTARVLGKIRLEIHGKDAVRRAKSRDRLDASYVRKLLARDGVISPDAFPNSLVEIKKLQLKIIRRLEEMK